MISLRSNSANKTPNKSKSAPKAKKGISIISESVHLRRFSSQHSLKCRTLVGRAHAPDSEPRQIRLILKSKDGSADLSMKQQEDSSFLNNSVYRKLMFQHHFNSKSELSPQKAKALLSIGSTQIKDRLS